MKERKRKSALGRTSAEWRSPVTRRVSVEILFHPIGPIFFFRVLLERANQIGPLAAPSTRFLISFSFPFFLFLFFYGETCGDDTVEEKNYRKSHWWNQKKISIQSKSEYENSRSHWTVFNEVKVSFFISRFSDFIDSIRLELIFFGDRLNGMRR